ncbi:MAG: phosphate ABC transporter permease PstA [Pseudomonadota bacterium]
MVDMTALSRVHGSAAAQGRMRRRRRAEVRLKVYGIAAILLAGLALVTLLWSVIGNAQGALTESYLTLAPDIAAEGVTADSDAEALRAVNFDGVTKDTLKAAFPDVTDRRERRELYAIVSSGAAFELRDAVLEDPSRIGEGAPFRFLASDDTDLYLQGFFGRLEDRAHSGQARFTSSDDGETVDVFLTANDLADTLLIVKERLRGSARTLRRQAALQDAGVRAFEREAEGATGEAREEALTEVRRRSDQRDRLIAQAEELEDRASRPSVAEEIGRSDPSILLRIGDTGWVKLTEVEPTGGRGVVLGPFETESVVDPSDWSYFVLDRPEAARSISDRQIVWIETLRSEGAVERQFNTRFFTSGNSRQPELAGIWGAVVGSFWTMLVTFVVAFPIGVLAAIYLEEFAPKNRFTDFIEVNINNLAAVPSIVFGLLGLAVFLTFFGVPRSAPLAGGLVLALMTLPTIIIASRASIRAVPPSIRDAALGLGASKLQTSFHHVLPLAMPGILTGTIIGMAQALGETAPLIMIGMVAFITEIPGGILDSASVLPVQVFSWSDFPERAFEARTAAAICVLLIFLIIMNAFAVFLRKRFERRW